jgi:bifunctional UDP-N-acetylglucosamine pyrophosphorylase/glucosamine-1-phosphate N-acetyltransferase
VLVAPVELGAEAVVAAGTVVTKSVPAGALVVARAKQEIKEGWSERRKKR